MLKDQLLTVGIVSERLLLRLPVIKESLNERNALISDASRSAHDAHAHISGLVDWIEMELTEVPSEMNTYVRDVYTYRFLKIVLETQSKKASGGQRITEQEEALRQLSNALDDQTRDLSSVPAPSSGPPVSFRDIRGRVENALRSNDPVHELFGGSTSELRYIESGHALSTRTADGNQHRSTHNSEKSFGERSSRTLSDMPSPKPASQLSPNGGVKRADTKPSVDIGSPAKALRQRSLPRLRSVASFRSLRSRTSCASSELSSATTLVGDVELKKYRTMRSMLSMHQFKRSANDRDPLGELRKQNLHD